MRWIAAGVLMCALNGCSDFLENHAIGQCEETIKSHLKSPASYRRVSVDGAQENLSNGMWKISYDAVNAFNAPIREQAYCSIKNGNVSLEALSQLRAPHWRA